MKSNRRQLAKTLTILFVLCLFSQIIAFAAPDKEKSDSFEINTVYSEKISKGPFNDEEAAARYIPDIHTCANQTSSRIVTAAEETGGTIAAYLLTAFLGVAVNGATGIALYDTFISVVGGAAPSFAIKGYRAGDKIEISTVTIYTYATKKYSMTSTTRIYRPSSNGGYTLNDTVYFDFECGGRIAQRMQEIYRH